MTRGRFGQWSCLGLAAPALAALALVVSSGASSAQQPGLYVALGDSISAGDGASSAFRQWVKLYYGHLQSNGSGVTELLKLARGGATSDDVRSRQLGSAVGAINGASDAKAVTIDVGLNDLFLDSKCPTVNATTCPVAANLREILAGLNAALTNDPGDETLQIMENYNPHIGTPNESATRQLLLGNDGRVDCSGTGEAVGLNDLLHCIGIEQRATPVDVLPIFDAAGEAFLAPDHVHPNDAGHRAIAIAFGGAATPTAPPPPAAPRLRASKPKVSRATAGRPLTAWMIVTNADTGAKVKGRVTCPGRLSGKSLRAKRHSSSSAGRSTCTWQLPVTARGKPFKGSITSRFRGARVSRSFSTRVR